MKVLFVLTYYRPHWTGLTQYAARLAEGLVKRDYQVEVLCSRHDKSLPAEEIINGVKVTRLNYLFKFLRSVIMPGFPLVLWRKIKKCDQVVVYLPMQEAALVALFARLQKKKLFLVHNGDLVLPNKCGFFCRLVEKIYFWTTAYAIKLSENVIVQTEDYAENSKLLKKFGNKWAVILPLYDIPRVAKKDVEDFKEKYLLKDKILIGYSGRFVEEKGVEYLLKTIPEVVKKVPNAHFVFAGDYKIKYEDYWDRISGLIEKNKERITLLGLIKDQKELFSFYKSLSVYVQPSVTDCFPSSLVEALLSGVPCVCTDIPGARWAIKETGMGEIVEPKNPQALAEGILKVMENQRKYLQNFKKAKEVFDYKITLKEHERIFRGTLKGN